MTTPIIITLVIIAIAVVVLAVRAWRAYRRALDGMSEWDGEYTSEHQKKHRRLRMMDDNDVTPPPSVTDDDLPTCTVQLTPPPLQPLRDALFIVVAVLCAKG